MSIQCPKCGTGNLDSAVFCEKCGTKITSTVLVKCKECGKEYELEHGEKPSDFICKCGGNLGYKKNRTLAKPKIVKKPRKTIFIPKIVSLILIVVTMIVVVNVGLIYSQQIKNQTNKSNNTTPIAPYIANKTYADNGMIFNYPADWQPIDNLNNTNRWGHGDPVVAFYDPNNGNEDDMDTYFYIKRRGVESLDDQLSSYRSDIAELGQKEVSERNITVNGMKAVELIKTWKDGNTQFQALTVHIEAVPGSKYYRIGCVTTADKFNTTLPKFELVVNSFKLQ